MEAIGGNGVVQYRHRIVAGGEVVAQHTRDSNVAGGNPRTTYTQTDMLGSIGLITDENANVIGKMHFDPWGKRLNADTWNGNPTSGQLTALRSITHRGFTDHEMLDSMNLVHMNGRIYDPNLGRMLSADPLLEDPANLQRYNRYSYVNNRPLIFDDPSGYGPRHLFGANVYTICNSDSCAQQMGGRSGYMGSAARAAGGVQGLEIQTRFDRVFGNTRFLFGGQTNASLGTGRDEAPAQLERVRVTGHRISLSDPRAGVASHANRVLTHMMNSIRARFGWARSSAAVWPTNHHGQVTRGYSAQPVVHPVTGESQPHTAVDMVNPQGDPVYAMWSGEVIDVGYTDGSGNYLYVQHANGYSTGYSHTGTVLSVGDMVLQGQQIGFSDGSGVGTGPHLHLVLRRGGRNGPRIDACTVLADC